MLFTFKSAATANLIMHEQSGKEILALLGKNPNDQRGIITVDQMAEAVKTLQVAALADKARPRETNADENDNNDRPKVSLAQRAAPFIEMLEQAKKGDEPVTWGV